MNWWFHFTMLEMNVIMSRTIEITINNNSHETILSNVIASDVTMVNHPQLCSRFLLFKKKCSLKKKNRRIKVSGDHQLGESDSSLPLLQLLCSIASLT